MTRSPLYTQRGDHFEPFENEWANWKVLALVLVFMAAFAVIGRVS